MVTNLFHMLDCLSIPTFYFIGNLNCRRRPHPSKICDERTVSVRALCCLAGQKLPSSHSERVNFYKDSGFMSLSEPCECTYRQPTHNLVKSGTFQRNLVKTSSFIKKYTNLLSKFCNKTLKISSLCKVSSLNLSIPQKEVQSFC